MNSLTLDDAFSSFSVRYAFSDFKSCIIFLRPIIFSVSIFPVNDSVEGQSSPITFKKQKYTGKDGSLLSGITISLGYSNLIDKLRWSRFSKVRLCFLAN